MGRLHRSDFGPRGGYIVVVVVVAGDGAYRVELAAAIDGCGSGEEEVQGGRLRD